MPFSLVCWHRCSHSLSGLCSSVPPSLCPRIPHSYQVIGLRFKPKSSVFQAGSLCVKLCCPHRKLQVEKKERNRNLETTLVFGKVQKESRNKRSYRELPNSAICLWHYFIYYTWCKVPFQNHFVNLPVALNFGWWVIWLTTSVALPQCLVCLWIKWTFSISESFSFAMILLEIACLWLKMKVILQQLSIF